MVIEYKQHTNQSIFTKTNPFQLFQDSGIVNISFISLSKDEQLHIILMPFCLSEFTLESTGWGWGGGVGTYSFLLCSTLFSKIVSGLLSG